MKRKKEERKDEREKEGKRKKEREKGEKKKQRKLYAKKRACFVGGLHRLLSDGFIESLG